MAIRLKNSMVWTSDPEPLSLWALEFRLRKELHYNTTDLQNMPIEQLFFYLGIFRELDLQIKKKAEELKKVK